MRIKLRNAGFAVDFAHTVDMALTRAGETNYAAVLADLRLREADGIDLILRLRVLPGYRDTPVMVISGDTERGRTDVRSSRLNVLEWFNKPVDFRRLIALLRTLTSLQIRERPRILHIEDDCDILAMVRHTLRPIAEVIAADSIDSARHILGTGRFDLAILGSSHDDKAGIDLLSCLADGTGNPVPVIVFSARGDRADGSQGSVAQPKSTTPLQDLLVSVRDRLALLPPCRALEIT